MLLGVDSQGTVDANDVKLSTADGELTCSAVVVVDSEGGSSKLLSVVSSACGSNGACWFVLLPPRGQRVSNKQGLE
jgi:hypothetical protein